MFYDGYAYHGTTFEQTYRCYPSSFIDKPQIESGDKSKSLILQIMCLSKFMLLFIMLKFCNLISLISIFSYNATISP
jgi:hypothetical protein